MRRSALVMVLLLGGACGRLRFDPLATGDGSTGLDDTGDGGGGFAPSRVFYIKATNTDAGDEFGYHVALAADGNTLAVAASLEDGGTRGVNGNAADNSATDAGAVYIYVRTGSTWEPQAYIKSSNADPADEFGWSISLSSDGNTLAVGARHEDSAAAGIGGNEASNAASDSGAVYVFTRTGSTWSQQAYIKSSNSNVDDAFGQSVSLSADGNTLVASSRFEDSVATGIGGNELDNTAVSSGAAYVFTRAGTVWTQQAYLKASNTGAGDFFGEAVAISADGNTLVVGAMFEGSGATGINGNQLDESEFESGAAYVFVRSGTVWTQAAYVKASNTEAQDRFGINVAMSSDGLTFAVGATFEDSNAAGVDGDGTNNASSNSGAVYVFERNGSWAQRSYLKATNPDALDQLGWGLALSGDGNTLAAGSLNEDSAASGLDGDPSNNAASNSGAAYVIDRAMVAAYRYVKAPSPTAGDSFGFSMALSNTGATLAVCAYGEDGSAKNVDGGVDENQPGSGAVFIYE